MSQLISEQDFNRLVTAAGELLVGCRISNGIDVAVWLAAMNRLLMSDLKNIGEEKALRMIGIMKKIIMEHYDTTNR